jgi:hypothetical protein
MSRQQTLLRRLPVLVLMLAVPLAIGALQRTHATHSLIDWLFSYSPARLVHGAIWTLPGSALLESRPEKLGLNVTVPMLVFAPYVLWIGSGRAVRTFFAGHVVATLTAAACILVGVIAGSAVAHHLYLMHDNGVSAGLAAACGGLGVLLWHSRGRLLAVLVLGVVLVLFTHRLAHERLGATLADGEHLVAIATGAFVEIRRRMLALGPRTPVPARPLCAPRT